MFSNQMAIAAYLASGMMRKTIAVPAEDRVREWRDWQAEADIITKIEDEEKRLNIQAKTMQGEVLRGIGGGAMILVTTGNHAEELKPETIAEGGLVAVNMVSRWDLQGHDWIRDIASPHYREPTYWTITADKGGQTRIHPSRVVCFRGAPLPTGSAVSDEEAFWGDSKLLRVFTEVMRSDESQAWFAALVKKAKLLRIGIPNLTDYNSTADGQTKLNSRVSLIAEGENSLNAVVYDAGDGTENSGEKITDYQITWNGIPAVMDAFDQRVACVSDIPFTRLTGRSPAGMNATGKSDMDNYNKMTAAGQRLELRPCLDQLDRALLPSAGVKFDDPKITWRFAPLELPDEKTEAETFKVVVEALEKLDLMGALPEEAFKELAQNLLAERQWLPGMDSVMKKFSDDEKFGPDEDDGTDPSEIVEGGDPASAGGGARRPAARAANDAAALVNMMYGGRDQAFKDSAVAFVLSELEKFEGSTEGGA